MHGPPRAPELAAAAPCCTEGSAQLLAGPLCPLGLPHRDGLVIVLLLPPRQATTTGAFAWRAWLLPCGQTPVHAAPSLIRGRTREAGPTGFWVQHGPPLPTWGQMLRAMPSPTAEGPTCHPLCLPASQPEEALAGKAAPVAPLCMAPPLPRSPQDPPALSVQAFSLADLPRCPLPPPSGKPASQSLQAALPGRGGGVGVVALSGIPLCRSEWYPSETLLGVALLPRLPCPES